MKKKKEYILSSLDNALKLLDALSVHDDVSLKELCEMTGLDKSSTFKMLYTMENRGYVKKTKKAHYMLGSKFTGYGSLQPKRKTLLEIATPYLDEIHKRYPGTVYMGILSTTGRMIITYLNSSKDEDGPVTRVGYEVDIHSNAMGKVLLAYTPLSSRISLLNQIKLTAYTTSTITSVKELSASFPQIKNDGYCIEFNEQLDGFGSIGIPVLDHQNQCVAVIGIACRNQQLKDHQDEMIKFMSNMAKAIQYNSIY